MSAKSKTKELIDEIQRLFYDENLTKVEIARRLNISRETVQKYIPVKADQGGQRCSNMELAKKQLGAKAPSRKSPPESPTGETFKVPKCKQTPPLPDAIERDTSAIETDLPGVWWVLSDIHLPFHDRAALEIGLKEAKRRGIVGILLNGDSIDCLGLSSKFHKRPDEHMFQTELDAWGQFVEWLRFHFPKIPIYYKRGNHEERFELYLAKFPEFFGIKHIQFENVMEFAKHGVTDVKDGRVIMLGELPVLHGHEYRNGISAPVNPARGAYMKLFHTVLVGHSHQTSEHSEKNMFGKVVVVWSTGCNCTLSPRYAPYNKWNHGGAFVDVASDGSYGMHNYKIIEGVLR